MVKTNPPQIADNLISTRCKDTIDIAKHSLSLLDAETLAEKVDDSAEMLRRADFENLLLEIRR